MVFGTREVEDVVAVEDMDCGANVGDVTVEVDVEVEAVVRIELLLCCVRCCGRDVTLNDERGRRSRMGVGTILFSSGTGDGDDTATGSRAGAGDASSAYVFGIMNRKAGMISSSSTSLTSGETRRTGAMGSGEGDTKLCTGTTVDSGPRDTERGGWSTAGGGRVTTSLDIRRSLFGVGKVGIAGLLKATLG